MVSGVFLALLLHHMDMKRMLRTMGSEHWHDMALAALCMVASLSIRAGRWHSMLKPFAPTLPLLKCAESFFIGMGANVVLPFRLGDVLRGTVMASRLKVKAVACMTTVILEKLLDLLVVLLIGGLALMLLPKESHAKLFDASGFLIAGGALGVMGFLCFARFFRRPVMAALSWASQRWLQDRSSGNGAGLLTQLEGRLVAAAVHVFDALDAVGQPIRFMKLLVLTVLSWGFEAMAFWLVAIGMPALQNATAAWLAMPVAALSTALPGTPGSIGTLDFFVEKVMFVLDNSRNASTAYAFLVHATILAVPLALALAGIFHASLRHEHLPPIKVHQDMAIMGRDALQMGDEDPNKPD
ncbi:lysylphosphatidylglycerol synthase transmembrane domain-containing protein [Formicincola oecophyllae]|uniref:lysylphosphatidylglycerol synthase transmembrane domain-containing protein n=1 Tax=Formicincola oecophyllae TaxID=2558361 RepID=UPI001F0E1237|nr:lysylphosphatidylglycerol synthase transmembrane domain-containing protein [Formicincola oecophyllae]